jgi:hypothetical protein
VECPGTPYEFFCPPSFVDTPAACWTCKHLWCPFCWGRLVAKETYDRFRQIDKAHFANHWIAEIRACEYLPYTLSDKAIRQQISSAAARFARQQKLGSSPGVFKLTTVEPAGPGCRVVVRIAALVTPKIMKLRPATTTPALEVVYHRTYGKNYELAKLVGRVCEYPFELLFQPAEEVKRVLGLREGLRLMSSSGLLRERRKPDEEDEQDD